MKNSLKLALALGLLFAFTTAYALPLPAEYQAKNKIKKCKNGSGVEYICEDITGTHR